MHSILRGIVRQTQYSTCSHVSFGRSSTKTERRYTHHDATEDFENLMKQLCKERLGRRELQQASQPVGNTKPHAKCNCGHIRHRPIQKFCRRQARPGTVAQTKCAAHPLLLVDRSGTSTYRAECMGEITWTEDTAPSNRYLSEQRYTMEIRSCSDHCAPMIKVIDLGAVE